MKADVLTEPLEISALDEEDKSSSIIDRVKHMWN